MQSIVLRCAVPGVSMLPYFAIVLCCGCTFTPVPYKPPQTRSVGDPASSRACCGAAPAVGAWLSPSTATVLGLHVAVSSSIVQPAHT